MRPGPPTPMRGGWDSASTSSPSTICARCPASRWNAATSTPRSVSPSSVLSITEQRRPLFEFLALLDRAQIWAARGLVRDALTTVGPPARSLSGASTALLARADEQEALLRLSLGDLRSPAELAGGCPPLAAACCWPGLRSLPVITLPPRNICRPRPGRPDATPGTGTPDTAGRRRDRARRSRGREPARRRPAHRPRPGFPQHRRHHCTAGGQLCGRARGPPAVRSVHRAADRRGARGARRPARRRPAGRVLAEPLTAAEQRILSCCRPAPTCRSRTRSTFHATR